MKNNLLKKHAKSCYWASFFLPNNALDKCSSPTDHIHEPWKVNEMERRLFNIKTSYPNPIVDVTEALKHARKVLWAEKGSKEVKNAKKAVLSVHAVPGRKEQ